MRKLILVLMFLSMTSQSQAAIQHIQTFQATPTLKNGVSSWSETFTSPTTTGNLIIVEVATYKSGGSPQISSITDTALNNYVTTGASVLDGTSSARIAIWYAKNITGNAANQVTVNVTGNPDNLNDLTIVLQEYSGADKTSPLGSINTGSGTSANPSAGALSPTDGNSLYIGCVSNIGAAATITPNASYTQRAENEAVTGMDINVEELISSGSQTPTWTFSASRAYIAAGATFKPAAADSFYSSTLYSSTLY